MWMYEQQLDTSGVIKVQLGADPNVMAWSLAGSMRPHHVLAHVEAGLPKPFAEGAILARRPDRQYAART